MCMHRPCIAPAHFHLLPSSSVSPSFASLAPMPPPVLICTPVLPLLVPPPQHWNHPMAHVACPTLAVVPPPHTGGPATSTRVCAQWRGMCGGLRGLAPPNQTMAGCTNQRQIHDARHRAVTNAMVCCPLSLSSNWVPFSHLSALFLSFSLSSSSALSSFLRWFRFLLFFFLHFFLLSLACLACLLGLLLSFLLALFGGAFPWSPRCPRAQGRVTLHLCAD